MRLEVNIVTYRWSATWRCTEYKGGCLHSCKILFEQWHLSSGKEKTSLFWNKTVVLIREIKRNVGTWVKNLCDGTTRVKQNWLSKSRRNESTPQVTFQVGQDLYLHQPDTFRDSNDTLLVCGHGYLSACVHKSYFHNILTVLPFPLVKHLWHTPKELKKWKKEDQMPHKATKTHLISKMQDRIWSWLAEDYFHCLIFIFLLNH